MTLTQDELRQLHEAGMPYVEIERKPATIGCCELVTYKFSLFMRLTTEAALVGYATQLLDEVYPNKNRYIQRCGYGKISHDGLGLMGGFQRGSNIESLTALIVDLARMKREKVKAPESVTTKEMKMDNGSSITFTDRGDKPFKSIGQDMMWMPDDDSVTRQEFDQLRADVREIASVVDYMMHDQHWTQNERNWLHSRLRAVKENNAAKEKV